MQELKNGIVAPVSSYDLDLNLATKPESRWLTDPIWVVAGFYMFSRECVFLFLGYYGLRFGSQYCFRVCEFFP